MLGAPPILNRVGFSAVFADNRDRKSLFDIRIWGVGTSSLHERWNIHFTGHVQGVGFRYNTQRLTHDLPVVGFVRNLVDGRVEVVVEGSVADLDSFRAKIEHAMSGHIQDIQVDRGLATGEFSSFEIRF